MQIIPGPATVPRSERKRGAANDTNPETRIGRHVRVQPNGCWLYNGKTDRYGRAIILGETIAVHRFVYETLVGPIEYDDHLHHKCETPGCCNPEHLTPLSPRNHKRLHCGTPGWDDGPRATFDETW